MPPQYRAIKAIVDNHWSLELTPLVAVRTVTAIVPAVVVEELRMKPRMYVAAAPGQPCYDILFGSPHKVRWALIERGTHFVRAHITVPWFHQNVQQTASWW